MVKPRVVNDNNIWLSALYFAGKPAQVVDLIEEKQVISVTSSPLLRELEEKMLTKFSTPKFLSTATISYIESISELVEIKGEDFGLRDPKDSMVIETAIFGRCDWIISGDKDLLVLKKFQEIPIVTPSQFLLKYRSS